MASPSDVLALSTLSSTRRMGLKREGTCLPIMFITQFDSENVTVTASYYPGRGQTMHPLAAFPTVPHAVIQGLDVANSDGSSIKNEEEWFTNGWVAGLADASSEALANTVCRSTTSSIIPKLRATYGRDCSAG